MRTHLEIDKETVEELVQLTGLKDPGAAIAFAARDYVIRHRADAFTRLVKDTKLGTLPAAASVQESDV